MIKDLNEELDVDKVKRASSSSPASSARSVTCLSFPCMDTTSLQHYTVEVIFMTFGQAARAREEGHGKDEMKGDKTGGKFKKKKGKPVATDRTQDSYQRRGWWQ